MKQLTDKQLENAARKLCELRGIDPDRKVPHGAPPNSMGFVPAVILYSPAWQLLAKDVKDFWDMIVAIDSVTDMEDMA